MHNAVQDVESLTRARELSRAALMRIATNAAITTHQLLDAVAVHIGRQYLSRILNYSDASMLMNRIMPEAGFELASPGFWEVYLAFEDAEVSDDPDAIARPRVAAALASLEAA